ncbi:MAG TPA: aldo/keto reductase [Solirubrobacteraceae bacterium]|nr:aldo/keto reductase [Solirubrobacteraceae bacterium]
MKTRTIGSLEVSLVGLGTNNFGGRLDLTATRTVLDASLDVGINFLDTADIYGDTLSEEFIGEALRDRRDRVVLATKFGIAIDDARPGGASPAYVRRALEDSLRRLQTDFVDLYQLHEPDPATPIADTIGVLQELRDEGKIIEIGCSNFTVAQLREAGGAFASVQNEYSLLEREAEADVLPYCEAEGIAFLPFFPLAHGLLTGKYRRDLAPQPGTRLAGFDAERRGSLLTGDAFTTVEQLEAFAQDRGHTLVELAIAALTAQPAIASVIAGATSAEQVAANAAAASWELGRDELELVHSL